MSMSGNITSVVDDLWPADSCDEFSARPLLPYTQSSRVCGVQTHNRTLMEACCTSTIEQYQCWMFCGYREPHDLEIFGRCIHQELYGINNTEFFGTSTAFCESNIRTRQNASISDGDDDETSFGVRSFSAPKISWIFFALLFSLFFIGPATAELLPSFNDLSRRQDDSDSDCTFNIERNFARGGRAVTVAEKIICADGPCWRTIDIDTGMNNINRTINGNSAADPEYDDFFDIVSKAVGGRRMPAQSQVQMEYGFGVAGDADAEYYVQFIPFYWCVNGTATNCDGVYGDTDDSQQVTACGPLFVGDASNNASGILNTDAVQGSVNIFTSS